MRLMTLAGLRRYGRIGALAVGLLLIVWWQAGFTSSRSVVDHRYKVMASTGINREPQFVFFLHHLGLFPIATNAPIRADTKEEAQRQLREEASSLKQDEGSTFRSGDRGRTFLYLLDTWLRKTSLDPRLMPANAAAFTIALMALFTAFWAIGRALQGAALCVLLGSNPFQLFVVYRQENVFSWAVTALVLVMAINVPVMWPKRPPWYPLVAAFATGVVLALVRTIRSEPTPLVFSAALVYAAAEGIRRLDRAKLVGVLALTFAVSSWGSLRYLDHKLNQSRAVVAEVGGSPYAGPVVAYHEFWHAIFCGLGDFDKKKGYAWDDRVAYRYALPILKARHPEMAKLDPYGAVQAWNYDAAGKYPFLFSEAPGYHEIIRDKVLGDITRDPAWYAKILAKRSWRILTETTPVAVALHGEHFETGGPLVGLASVPLALFLFVSRRWFYLKLLVFAVPLSAAPLFIYSDRGMNSYTTFHIIGAFVMILLVVEGARKWLRLRRRVLRG